MRSTRPATVTAALVVALVTTLTCTAAVAKDALVAVAANFLQAAKSLEQNFEQSSEHKISIASGSTGKLYTQIINGAPFDVLLAADQERPMLLEQNAYTVADSRFVYATGKLTLWSADPHAVSVDGAGTLRAGDFRSLAIANPQLAPYGHAARSTLHSLNLWKTLQPRIVMGENVGQAYALVATQNAELGFVSMSLVMSSQSKLQGSYWDVPAELHEPILQDAVLLRHGRDNVAAIAFLEYLKSDAGQSVIAAFGYRVD